MDKICNNCSVILTSENWYPSFQKKYRYTCKSCNSILQKKYYPKGAISKKVSKLLLKKEIIEAYGGKCQCCSTTHWPFLTIDHVNGQGNLHRKNLNTTGGDNFYYWLKKQNFPKDNYQLLCFNCNITKGHQGFCPCIFKFSNSSKCYFCSTSLNLQNTHPFNQNKHPICFECLLQQGRGTQIYHKKYKLNKRLIIINNYGNQCVSCGEKEPYHLAIDHINNDGYLERTGAKFYNSLIRENFPKDRYQLLCHNCNSSKNRFGITYPEYLKSINKKNISIDSFCQIIKNAN